MQKLETRELTKCFGSRAVVDNLSLELHSGEVVGLLGPNGAGKTTTFYMIAGLYRPDAGNVYFNGEDITYMPINERACLGIGVSFQRPPTINGLKTREIVKICDINRSVDVEELAKELRFTDFLDRDVNDNFSGGEIKRSELLQLMAQQPDLVLLDEPESGVDLENIVLVGDTINSLLRKQMKCPKDGTHKRANEERVKSALVITHTGNILDYITADRGQVLYNGVLCCSKNAREILNWIREYGYEECVRCSK